jgi:uncharacterized protein (DUF488 family)
MNWRRLTGPLPSLPTRLGIEHKTTEERIQSMHPIRVYTIGFTQKSAETFFTTLCAKGVKRVIDVRLNNVSQLAGFSKKDDLRYFLKVIGPIDYVHEPLLAPTQEIIDGIRKDKWAWSKVEDKFLGLMAERKIEEKLSPELFDGGCLLCSEDQPDRCHRRLVAEYLQRQWGNLEIVHL